MSLLQIKALGLLGTSIPTIADTIRIDGYPGKPRVLTTLSVRSTGYLGDVDVQVSMSPNPSSDDWYTVHTITFSYAPSTQGLNLLGKYVWMRLSYDETIPGSLDTALVR